MKGIETFMVWKWGGGALAFLTLCGLVIAAGAAAPKAATRSSIRFVHAIPDGGPVDIYVGTKKLLTGVPYRKISGYYPFPAGTHQIKVTPTGSTEPLVDFPVTLKAGTAYTAAATGTLKTLKPVLLTDDLRAPNKGGANVRVVHLAPDAPPVDVWAAKPTEQRLFKSATYQKGTSYAPIRAGRYTLEVRPTGSPYAVKSDVPVTIAAGANVTAFAFGLLKGEDAQAFTLVTAPDEPNAKAATASSPARAKRAAKAR